MPHNNPPAASAGRSPRYGAASKMPPRSSNKHFCHERGPATTATREVTHLAVQVDGATTGRPPTSTTLRRAGAGPGARAGPREQSVGGRLRPGVLRARAPSGPPGSRRGASRLSGTIKEFWSGSARWKLAALRTSTLDVSSLNCGWRRDRGRADLAGRRRAGRRRARAQGGHARGLRALGRRARAVAPRRERSRRRGPGRDRRRRRRARGPSRRRRPRRALLGAHGRLLVADPKVTAKQSVPVQVGRPRCAPGRSSSTRSRGGAPTTARRSMGLTATTSAPRCRSRRTDAGRGQHVLGAAGRRESDFVAVVEAARAVQARGSSRQFVARDDAACSLVVLDGAATSCLSARGWRPWSSCRRATCRSSTARPAFRDRRPSSRPSPAAAPVTYAPSSAASRRPTYAPTPARRPSRRAPLPRRRLLTRPGGASRTAAPPVLSGGALALRPLRVVRRCRGGNKPVGKGGYARAKSAEDDPRRRAPLSRGL